MCVCVRRPTRADGAAGPSQTLSAFNTFMPLSSCLPEHAAYTGASAAASLVAVRVSGTATNDPADPELDFVVRTFVRKIVIPQRCRCAARCGFSLQQDFILCAHRTPVPAHDIAQSRIPVMPRRAPPLEPRLGIHVFRRQAPSAPCDGKVIGVSQLPNPAPLALRYTATGLLMHGTHRTPPASPDRSGSSDPAMTRCALEHDLFKYAVPTRCQAMPAAHRDQAFQAIQIRRRLSAHLARSTPYAFLDLPRRSEPPMTLGALPLEVDRIVGVLRREAASAQGGRDRLHFFECQSWAHGVRQS